MDDVTRKMHSQENPVFRCQANYLHTIFQGADLCIILSTEKQLHKHNIHLQDIHDTAAIVTV